jgi:hypothetical protein
MVPALERHPVRRTPPQNTLLCQFAGHEVEPALYQGACLTHLDRLLRDSRAVLRARLN